MDWLHEIVDLFLHLDRHLDATVQSYGGWTHAILFVIVFLETGVVVTPFLPGDSLLFAGGAIAARGSINVWLMFVLLSAAAILGDTVNYWIGKHFGAYLLAHKARLFRPQHLARTHAFFEKYGGKTIVLARFVPIVRTFAPFVAGMGAMTYPKFVLYNVVGALAWVGICLAAGYWFGGFQVVRDNFSLVILAIVFLSVLPIAIEFILHKRRPAAIRTDAQPVAERAPVESE
jgi:membrane-associated protein